ncbi:MAG TPA: hypothetical protein VL486_02080 [Verrucomicrobiae bacterium]|nr:hypothetical protein [Verrucomicrobiae bacterium]
MKKIRLPEPEAVKEVHSWRRKSQKRAGKVGWKKYLAELNKQPPALPEKPRSVVRECSAKKYGR